MMGRARAAAIVLATSACAALLRIFPPDRVSWYPACPLHSITGIACPLCGGTRALACLAAGQWTSAIQWNALVAIAAPLLMVRLIWISASGKGIAIPERSGRYLVAVAMGFMAWRNLI
jgi:Protein of unknown function (DUF2752)